MKGFFAAFVGWFVAILVLIMIFGNIIFNNAYALIALAALILAVFTVLHFELSEQVEELQKRLDALEGKEPAAEKSKEKTEE